MLRKDRPGISEIAPNRTCDGHAEIDANDPKRSWAVAAKSAEIGLQANGSRASSLFCRNHIHRTSTVKITS